MNVSYQWLSQYVDLQDVDSRTLAELLTRGGVEVDAVESRNAGVSEGVLVGYVKAREKHPNADKLSVCTVDVGAGEDLQIVCGAQNVAAGQKVPVATVGSVLPGDFKIKKAKLRDVESYGMICSAKELGLNEKMLPKEQQEGILVLPADSEIGRTIQDFFGLADEVLELGLTPNRSDCLSMLGVAYEVAALLGRDVQLPEVNGALSALANGDLSAADHVKVNIEASEGCSLYSARIIDGVRIAPSPQWLQNRLLAAGVRPINNVVDVTNFVMLEYGQPLHAFDRLRLSEGIIKVRFAREGESLETLDGQVRTLQSSMLVIADGEQAVALAGVMGGASSEVTAETTRILLESAKFAGAVVRKTSRQLGLRSESSLRFEKEVNVDAVMAALDRAAVLIAELAGGTIAEGIVSASTATTDPLTVGIKLTKINDYLGTSLTGTEVQAIFERLRLGSQWSSADDAFQVTIPKRRGDISRDVDLIEEVARLYGYDNIPTSLVYGDTTVGALSPAQAVRRTVRRTLAGFGLDEVINYSFTHPQKSAVVPGVYGDKPAVKLALPMSEERSVLRQSLIPHLLDVVAHNRNHNQADVAVFEIGHVFVTDEEKLSKLPEQPLHLGLLLTGLMQSAQWLQAGRAVDFFDLKGVLERLLASLGIFDVTYSLHAADGFHPGRTAQLTVERNGQTVVLGVAGQLHPQVQQEQDLADTYVAELDMYVIASLVDTQIAYRALPRFPESKRDLALVVGREVASSTMVDVIRQVGGELLQSVQVFDVYTGEKIDASKKSVAFSLVFRHDDRTLQDEEVQSIIERILQALADTFAAILRS